MSKKHGFLKGAMIGVGLGLLFAPKKGTETREDLKKKTIELVDKIKEIDYVEVKNNLLEKVDDLKKELQDLDKEKALELAKEKAAQIEKKAEELLALAKEKATPVIEKTAAEVKEKTIVVLKDVIHRLEKEEVNVEVKKVSTPKKSNKKNNKK